MNKQLFRSIFLFILSIPTLIHAQTANNIGTLYEVTGKGLKKPSYLFGTYHLLKSGYLNGMPKVEECFNKAKGVVVEVDFKPEDIATIQGSMGMKDKKVTDLITKEEADMLDAKLMEATGMGLVIYNNLKPSAIVVTLSAAMPEDVKSRLEKYDGVLMDMYFMQQGKTENKTVTGLETAVEQANILFGDSLDKQVQNLKKFISKMDEADTISNKLIDLYFAQDLDGLFNLSLKYGKDFDGDMQKLLYDRNTKWLKALPKLFKKESQFVAVGALHLAGEEGLLNQLRKAGYTVKPIL